MTGTVLLTGATSGIGAASAERLAMLARCLVLHGPEPAEAVDGLLDRLRALGRAEVHYVPADFDHLDQVRNLADRVAERTGQVDVLVNNAGRPGPPRRRLSADGNESTLQTNYLAAVLLTERIRPLMPDSGRIVHVSSATHLSVTLDLADLQLERGYDPVRAYARSKLAMVAHAARQAGHYRQSILSLHPGVISTGLLHAMFTIGGRSAETAAEVVVAATSRTDVPSGAYLDEGRPAAPGAQARDPAFRDELHRRTMALLRPWTDRPDR